LSSIHPPKKETIEFDRLLSSNILVLQLLTNHFRCGKNYGQVISIIDAIAAMKKASRRIITAMNAAAKEHNGDRGEMSIAQESSLDAFYQRMFDRDIYLHVSEISVMMLGVCLTGVSILNVDQDLKDGGTNIDDLLAIDAFVFLTAYLLSYWVVRVMTKGDRNVRRIGNIANAIFLLGMIVMAVVCGCIVIKGDLASHFVSR
jgi:hypothetical protein